MQLQMNHLELQQVRSRVPPIVSFQVIAGEKALERRRMGMLLKYYYKIRRHIENPAFREMRGTSPYNLFINKRFALPVPLRALEVKRAV